VLEDAPGGQRINRINYEICVLQTLRERLRCKEIWVAGAARFRNPDEDLPADFDQRRAACYERLSLPTQVGDFIGSVRADLAEALRTLDDEMPHNSGVRLDPRRRHPIIVSPLDPQPEPPGLSAIKAELARRWPMTGLLDVLKETDLRVGFTEAFTTALRREVHEGLNVVESWNSANGFIFFGKGGEVASNRLDDQEVSVHALHLLQSCLVYVNTLMLQRVLVEPTWLARLTPADRRGLTPLVWGHVSPYGAFDLDMEQRLDLDLPAAAA